MGFCCTALRDGRYAGPGDLALSSRGGSPELADPIALMRPLSTLPARSARPAITITCKAATRRAASSSSSLLPAPVQSLYLSAETQVRAGVALSKSTYAAHPQTTAICSALAIIVLIKLLYVPVRLFLYRLKSAGNRKKVVRDITAANAEEETVDAPPVPDVLVPLDEGADPAVDIVNLVYGSSPNVGDDDADVTSLGIGGGLGKQPPPKRRR